MTYEPFQETAPYDPSWLLHCDNLAKLSPCSTKIGAVVVNPTTISVYEGWNAPPPGTVPVSGDAGCKAWCARACKLPSEKDAGYNDCPTVHAEMAAIMSAGRMAVGATLYVNGAPCRQCAKLIAFGKIAQVVCRTTNTMRRQRLLDDTVRYLEAARVKVWVLEG